MTEADLSQCYLRRGCKLTADIANSIAESYRDRVIEFDKKRVEQALSKIASALDAQEKKVSALESADASEAEVDAQRKLFRGMIDQHAEAQVNLMRPSPAVIIHERAIP